MKLTRVATEGTGSRIDWATLSPGLNVVVNRDERGAELLSLAESLLWGASGPDPLGPLVRERVGGLAQLESGVGPYRLRRQWVPEGARHTIARLDGQPASGDDIPRLLQGLSPRVLAAVFGADLRERPQLSELLSSEAAAQFRRVEAAANPRRTGPSYQSGYHGSEIFARRDEVARNVEQRLAERRQASARVESELVELGRQLEAVDAQLTNLNDELHTLQTELSSLDARVRYTEIAQAARLAEDESHESAGSRRTDGLDTQIDRWRATLSDIEARHAQVLAQLSHVHPHESSLAASVGDQRACLAVIDRLMRDVDAEVARFARTNTSWACMCRDAHSRLHPLTETLGRQFARLSELVQHHERAAEVRELTTEAEDLERSRGELRQQLEHLLQRRQDALRSGRPRREAPLSELSARPPLEGDPRTRRLELQREEATALRERDDLANQRDRLQQRQEELLRQRNELLRDSGLVAHQRELEQLQRELDHTLATPGERSTTFRSWRASDVLAKLTDGRITALHLRENGRSIEAQEISGRRILLQEMSAELQDLAYLALKLAMVDAYACHGVAFPLVLIEPFARLGDAPSRVLAGVLADLGQRGRQVLVATTNRAALERFQSLGAAIFEPTIGSVPVNMAPRFEPEVMPTPTPAPTTIRKTITTTDTYFLRPEDAIERFPVPLANRAAAFERARIRTVGDLLSADPSSVAEELAEREVSAELVSLWQLHAGLVCFVPGLSLADAQLLTELGVQTPHDLAQRTSSQITDAARGLADRSNDNRWRDQIRQLDSGRADKWISAARNELPRLEQQPVWQSWRRHADERRERTTRRSSGTGGGNSRAERPATLKLRTAPTERRSKRERDATQVRDAKPARRRFYLDTTSDVEQAPSIGAKMAERLKMCGIRTVADLLSADGDRLAAELGGKEVDGATVVAWQHQARLVCRIPELRGHDAQILVACGFSIAEEIATMKPAELLSFVSSYCGTPEAQRVLRNSPPPDLQEVTGWIEQARHCRVLGAA
jgi:predicted flap endonuclease-1-like 5' DNA nuclease